MKQLGLIIKLGSALALGVVAIGLALEKSAERQTERFPASALVSNPSATGKILFRPQSNQRYTYSFRRKIELSGLGTEIPSIAYTGKFTLDVLAVDASGFTAIAQAKVNEYAGKEAPLLHVRMGSDGRKIEIKAAPTNDEELLQYSAVTKDLLSLWDFSADTDTLGKYEFSLETLPTQPNFQVQKKTKLKYLTQQQTQITSSAHWLRWDDQLALPAEVKGEEATRLGQGGATLDSHTSYQLKFEARSELASYNAKQLAKLSQTETLALVQSKASDHADYKKVDWGALTEKLSRLDKMSSNERLAAFGDLTRLLRQDPTAIGQVLALLSAADIRAGADSALFKTIVGALASSGSPANQKALVGLYEDPNCPISGKGTILSAFTTAQSTPTSETTDFLRGQMESQKNSDLAQGASYALGSGLASSTGESADAALSSLRAQWTSALARGDTNAELSLLDAIGNSGRAEFFPDLKNIVESEAAISLRAKATFSMRFMNTGGSTAVIVGQFTNANENLRESAVAAVTLAPWAEQFRAPLQSCASHEAIPRIKKECDELLATHSQVAGN